MRVLIAVTHLLGAGHLTRAAAIARAFARAGHEATLVSGGRPAPHIPTTGVRLVQLPPVQAPEADFATLVDEHGQPAGPAHLAARCDALVWALEHARPDAVITELFPFGRRALADEFSALVERARTLRPRPLILSSVRDVLVAPITPGRVAQAHARLRTSYDAVLVHGDPGLVPLDRSWLLDDEVRGLLRYTGYVDDGAPTAPRTGNDAGADVVVSGGSSAASLPLYRAALGAAALLPSYRWLVLVGSGVPDATLAALASNAPANAAIAGARPDFRSLIAAARVSVSQAGYNTTVDLLRARPRAVLVPFEGGRETEQRIRAESLAARGVARLLPEAELGPAALASCVAAACAGPPPPALPVRLDGAKSTVAAVAALTAGRAAALPA